MYRPSFLVCFWGDAPFDILGGGGGDFLINSLVSLHIKAVILEGRDIFYEDLSNVASLRREM